MGLNAKVANDQDANEMITELKEVDDQNRVQQILDQLKLENCESVEELDHQMSLVDYWVDEILENAMNEVPIFILFCTKVPLNQENTPEIEIQSEIANLFQQTCDKYRFINNIHVIQSNNWDSAVKD